MSAGLDPRQDDEAREAKGLLTAGQLAGVESLPAQEAPAARVVRHTRTVGSHAQIPPSARPAPDGSSYLDPATGVHYVVGDLGGLVQIEVPAQARAVSSLTGVHALTGSPARVPGLSPEAFVREVSRPTLAVLADNEAVQDVLDAAARLAKATPWLAEADELRAALAAWEATR